MKRSLLLLILSFAAGLPGPLKRAHAARPATTPGVDADLARAVRDLGDERFDIREKASATLFAAGFAAEPALRKAAAGDDPEVRLRAQKILDSISHGIFPDTPAEIADLATRYSSADDGEKMKILYELAGRGGNGCVVLLKLAEEERDPDIKKQIGFLITGQAPRIPEAAALLLATGDVQRAQRLLATAATTGEQVAARAYGALLLSTGQLPATIAQLHKRAEDEPAEAAKLARTLCYLHRANGDLKNAAAAADVAGDIDSAVAIALEGRDWNRLAALLEIPLKADPNNLRQLGYLATAQRLAGDQAAFAKSLARVHELIAREKETSSLPISILVVNDQLDAVTDLLVRRKNYVSAYSFYCYASRFAEAAALADKAKAENHPDAAKLAVMAARVNWLLGEDETALATLAAVAGEKNTLHPWVTLCETEREIGQSEPSIAAKVKPHALASLQADGGSGSPALLFDAIFPGSGPSAAQWWDILKQLAPDEAPEDRFDKLAAIVNQTISPQDLEALAQEAAAKARLGPPENYPSRRRLLLLLGNTLKAAQRQAAADLYFDQLAMLNEYHGEWMDVAHRAAEKKEWARAADYYARAGSTPETTWLHGWALQQDGKDAQGREMMRRAETLTLGDERLMTALAAAMESHGRAKDAELQRRRLERVGTPRTWFYYNNCLFLGKTLADQNDSAGAAEYWQIYILSTLESAGPISNEMAFIRTPGLIHLHRGRGLIRQGRVEEAMREYRLTLEDAPGHAQPTVDLVPELRKLGHEAAARQLFDLSYAKLQGFCAKYARSAYFHNEIAWLCTRCGYEADAALTHAQRAVELRPRSTACLDTLAEVHFHRGERAKAVALMQQCEALQPREPRHRKRREEFEKGPVN